MPIVQELNVPPSPNEALRQLEGWGTPILFESASLRPFLGRYSFLTADPLRRFQIGRVDYGHDPLRGIEEALAQYHVETIPGLPPFQGGAAGLLGFELGGAWEKLPRHGRDEFGLPDLAVGIYDWVLAWDHATGKAWVIAHGLKGSNSDEREDAARTRIADVLRLLNGSNIPSGKTVHGDVQSDLSLAETQGIPTDFPGVFSDFSREDYLRRVERVIEYIHAGDVFQVNLSQRLLARSEGTAFELYERLRERNPAPFAAYFQWDKEGEEELAGADSWAIVSASPERFLALCGRDVETRPIKGTRRRSPHPAADLFVKDELRESDKDLAENTMIVDLLRNDLSRVCQPGSIRVPQFCEVETYQTVQHLVSEVRGVLEEGAKPFDLIRAAFPGGSITGAPKVRSVEIISELEPTVRGPYCGSLFYHGFDGSFDSNLLIRTFIQARGWLQFPVGGGIVSDSDPGAEYAETLHKAAGLLSALPGKA